MKYNAQILGRKNAFTCSQISIKISLEIGCKNDEFSSPFGVLECHPFHGLLPRVPLCKTKW